MDRSGLHGSATGAWEIRGPRPPSPIVEAWTNEYIRFEHRSRDQDELRGEIRGRVAGLHAAPGEVLQAAFLGTKPRGADVENLALYNIDDTGGSFADAARWGLRFELAAARAPSASGTVFTYGYRYELAPREGDFQHWRATRELAAWDSIGLGRFDGERRLEQVWLALARGDVAVANRRRQPAAPFAVRVSLRPPHQAQPLPARLFKGVVDGVVVALQAHTDRSGLAELAARLAGTLPASAADIAELLADRDRAVLGVVPRMLHLRGNGVQWAPADDRCLAGELLLEESTSGGWAITGSVVELRAA